MNSIIRIITVSFMISLLVFGIAGYGGSKSRSLPLCEAFEDLQTSFAFMLQESVPFAVVGTAPGTSGICFGDRTVSLPIYFAPENMRPF